MKPDKDQWDNPNFRLLNASMNGHDEEIAELLVSGTVDVNTKDSLETTVLMHAVRSCRKETVMQLIRAGAEVNVFNKNNQSALTFALRQNLTGSVNALLYLGADVNLQDKYGVSPIMVVAGGEYDDRIMAKGLVQNGADVNARDTYGKTALMYAASKNNDGTEKVLIDAGADVNAIDDNGQTALSIAVQNGYIDVLLHLVKNGAKVNDINNDGLSPLNLAVFNGGTKTFRVLLENGADIHAVNGRGETPFDFFLQNLSTAYSPPYFIFFLQHGCIEASPEGLRLLDQQLRKCNVGLRHSSLSFAALATLGTEACAGLLPIPDRLVKSSLVEYLGEPGFVPFSPLPFLDALLVTGASPDMLLNHRISQGNMVDMLLAAWEWNPSGVTEFCLRGKNSDIETWVKRKIQRAEELFAKISTYAGSHVTKIRNNKPEQPECNFQGDIFF